MTVSRAAPRGPGHQFRCSVTASLSSNAGRPWDPTVIAATIDELSALRADLVELPTRLRDALQAVHPANAAGAMNLVHYIGLRRHDLRALQERLAWVGVSSLGRAESHVLANVDKVLGLLNRLAGRSWTSLSGEEPAGIRTGSRLLEEHACALLGPTPEGRSVRIMVTLGTEAASDYGLVRDMLAGGMNCARINCAHDDASAWAAMVANIQRARGELERPCAILFDVAGPKLRTGPLEAGPAVMKVRPIRDQYGRVLTPARLRLMAQSDSTPAAGGWLQVDANWLTTLAEGDRIKLADARGASRTLTVCEIQDSDRWVECRQTVYVEPGTMLQLRRGPSGTAGQATPVLAVPVVASVLRLRKGDTLILTRQGLGRPAKVDAQGQVVQAASIPCTLPEVIAQVRPGERVWFDDGRIGGIIRQVRSEEVDVEITVTRETGAKLAADKGINLPDTNLELAALTAKDLEDLEFVARHADMIGLSFVRQARDIEQLQKHLTRLDAADVGIVLKIENRAAFEHLPDLLLAGMRGRRLGVMIARGDLAVEIGWERLAEVQEEILWLVEAGYVPVIWATQVLETLAKQGLPSRAEITDAAMGERAECVMLNKGPHILEAIKALDDILTRMQAHQHKKRSMLRQLHW
jgi:pyruvate kinase